LATRGYAVLFPDSPQQVGNPMAEVLKTVLPGVNRVVEMGIADPHRLGVMGFSNGGYSTLALIVQTRQFSAALEIEGMADLIGAYGEMNKAGAAYASALFEHGQDGLGGTPWEVRDKYIENSPICYLDRVSTPLLMVQGDMDSYVAPFLADELFVGMRRLGKEVEYAKYRGEGHDPVTWSYSHQVDLSRRILRWFDTHLRD
jgi:dipeptidyl aminopeptidase/acylaminoacyl peptidase